MKRGPVYLSIGEEEVVSELQRIFGITEIEAVDHVIAQKRELVFLHAQKGNFALAEQLKNELGE